MLREIPLARHAWELLKPLQSNADTVNVERHLPTQFQLAPPKFENGMPFQSGYPNIPNPTVAHTPPNIESPPPPPPPPLPPPPPQASRPEISARPWNQTKVKFPYPKYHPLLMGQFTRTLKEMPTSKEAWTL